MIKEKDIVDRLRTATFWRPGDNYEAAAEIERLRTEEDESDRLRSRLSRLLEESINHLRGNPEELRRHSWHDLPDLCKIFGACRWGVVFKGAVVVACLSRKRAEQIAALGSRDSDAPCTVVDLRDDAARKEAGL